MLQAEAAGFTPSFCMVCFSCISVDEPLKFETCSRCKKSNRSFNLKSVQFSFYVASFCKIHRGVPTNFTHCSRGHQLAASGKLHVPTVLYQRKQH